MRKVFIFAILITLSSNVFAQESKILREVARKYKATPQEVAMLRAIRNAEAGRPGFELGVEHPKAKGIKRQYSWALYEIRQNARRWYALDKKPCFIALLASDYCPQNQIVWRENVKRLYLKYTKGGA